MAKTEVAADIPADKPTIQYTRRIEAKREAVWKAYSDPKALAKWWGPNGFTITNLAMEFRVGGMWRFIMHAPAGEPWNGGAFSNRIIYRELKAPERMVFDHGSDIDNDPNTFHVVITFGELPGGATELKMHQTFPSVEARNAVMKFGAVELGKQTLNKMATSAERDPTLPSVRIERVFDAPRTRVFATWTDAKHFAKWWGPHGFDTSVCEVEARPGGTINVGMRNTATGDVHMMRGEVLAVRAPETFVFITTAFGEPDAPGVVNHNTVTLTDQGDKTLMVLETDVLSASDEIRPHLSGMEEGWRQSLEKMAALVGMG